MNSLLLFASDFTNSNCVRLNSTRMLHAFKDSTPQIDQTITVGIAEGKLGVGIIKEISPTHIDIEVNLLRDPPPPLPITLICALPRPKSMRKVIHAAVTLGIKKIYLIETWRVEKPYWQSPWLAPEYLHSLSVMALEQAVDTVLPTITLKKRFKPFVEDEIADITKDHSCFVAHPHGQNGCPSSVDGKVCLAVGPEGGFNDFEIEQLENRGFGRIMLGERQLRVEEAVSALVGRLIAVSI